MRSDQFEYVWLILLAVMVGTCGALGNLGFRALIVLCSTLFRNYEWRALGIGRGGFFVALIPWVLISGGVAIYALEPIFPGDVLGYGFPNFLAMLHLARVRIRKRWI